VKRYTDQLDSAEAIILSLARTIEARDSYTQGHCERLALYSTALGRALALSSDELAALYRGAFLHDIGKVGIPDAVLLKPGRLTPEEYDVMKRHTIIGDELCGNLASLQPVRPIVRHHHERLDGSGYPDGLVGNQIPVLTQIVSLVDTYDAITTTRPYQAARPREVAYAELALEVERGWRSAEIVDTFVQVAKRGLIG
jgi:putative two-component system response regulator